MMVGIRLRLPFLSPIKANLAAKLSWDSKGNLRPCLRACGRISLIANADNRMNRMAMRMIAMMTISNLTGPKNEPLVWLPVAFWPTLGKVPLGISVAISGKPSPSHACSILGIKSMIIFTCKFLRIRWEKHFILDHGFAFG